MHTNYQVVGRYEGGGIRIICDDPKAGMNRIIRRAESIGKQITNVVVSPIKARP